MELEGIFEILMLWVATYYIYRSFRATRAARILVGLAFLFLIVAFLAHFFRLEVIKFLLESLLALLSFALIIIFQPELRSALARLGSRGVLRSLKLYENTEFDFVEELERTVISLSKKRTGALLSIENKIQLKDVIETGTELDAKFSEDLCQSIFFPKSPLHDGGIVIRANRVVAAGCIFPVSSDYLKDRSLGLRHRAGIGLMEEYDAICIITSEETGSISLCANGELIQNLSEDEFRKKIKTILLGEGDKQLD